MLTNKICFYDFESGSKDPFRTQPLQLSCIMIDPVKLEIIPNSIFNSYIRAEEDVELCEKEDIDVVQQEALDINHITWEQIRSAPPLSEVWDNFVNYIGSYSKTKNQWDAPVRAGYNICNFDNKIIDRLCMKFGPYDDTWNTQKLFQPIHSIDIMHDVQRWTMGQNFRSISMDNVRKWLGINDENAHNAKKDILDGGFLMIKFCKLYRYFFNSVEWENSFEKENEIIKALMNE